VTTTPTVWRNQFVDNATDNGFQQDSGVVAATSDGNFYAIWRDSGNFNSGHSDIVGRSFDTFGTPVGGDVYSYRSTMRLECHSTHPSRRR